MRKRKTVSGFSAIPAKAKSPIKKIPDILTGYGWMVKMKLFDKYFKPYAEYCLRTTFSEDELKTVFEKELPHVSSFAAFKAGFEANKFTFFRRSKPFHLYPVITSRNSLRGEIAVKCEKSEYSPETILHITIAPQNIIIRMIRPKHICLGIKER